MRIYLAAGEQDAIGEVVEEQAGYFREHDIGILASYEGLKKNAIDLPRKQDGIVYVIDSGAYTYMNPVNIVTVDAMLLFADRYIAWAKQAASRYRWFAEMDVDRTYGHDFVRECRKRMIKAGIPVQICWHRFRGIEDWKACCRDFKYVGLSSQEKGLEPEIYVEFAKYAYQNGNMLHLFGVTAINLLTKVPCSSADSTSWISIRRWGQMLRTGVFARRYQRGEVHQAAILSKRRSEKMIPRWRELMPAILDEISYTQERINELWLSRGVKWHDS